MGKKRKGRLREFQRKEQEVSTSKARELRQEKIQQKRSEDTKRSQKKKKKVRWNRTRIITVIVLVLIGAFVVISGQKIISLKLEQRDLEKKNEQLQNEKAQLEDDLKNVGSKKYIEKQAREILKMVKPNEKLFIIDDDKDDNGKN